jgi:putative endonuclease
VGGMLAVRALLLIPTTPSFPRRRESINFNGSGLSGGFGMKKQGYVYILASGKHGTLYVGVTSDLMARLYQHREKVMDGFTGEHEVNRLIWYEVYDDMTKAIQREKRLKKWNRDWKIRLIEEQNPGWVDLAVGLGFDPMGRKKQAK